MSAFDEDDVELKEEDYAEIPDVGEFQDRSLVWLRSCLVQQTLVHSYGRRL